MTQPYAKKPPQGLRRDEWEAEHIVDGLINPQKHSALPELPIEERLLIDRKRAAQYLSLSQRSLDYLIANKQMAVRRIGGRVLIPLQELKRFAKADHTDRIVA